MRFLLFIASLIIGCVVLSACDSKKNFVDENLHPSLNLYRMHYLDPPNDKWLGDLNKSEYGDEFLGQANFQVENIFPGSPFATTQFLGSQSATGVVEGNWKDNANRLIARLPRAWWKISPSMGESQTPPPEGSVTKAEAEKLAENDGFGFFAIPKSASPGPSAMITIIMGPMKGDSSKTQVFIQTRPFPAWPMTPQDISSSSDRDKRAELQLLGVAEDACVAPENVVRYNNSGVLVDRNGNLVYYHIANPKAYYTFDAKLVDGRIVGGRDVFLPLQKLPNC
jgi:hypothetical protein